MHLRPNRHTASLNLMAARLRGMAGHTEAMARPWQSAYDCAPEAIQLSDEGRAIADRIATLHATAGELRESAGHLTSAAI